MAGKDYRGTLAILSKEKIKNGKKVLDRIITVLKAPNRDPGTAAIFKEWGLKTVKAKKREAQVSAMWEDLRIIHKGGKKRASTTFPYTPWKLLSDAEKQKKVDTVLMALFGKTCRKAVWVLLASLDGPGELWAGKKARKIKRCKRPVQAGVPRPQKAITVGVPKQKPPIKPPGRIGNIGKTVLFSTSSKKILTFSKMGYTVKGRWASRPRFRGKPRKQFLGPDTETISLTVELNALHGVKPRKTARAIERLIRSGKPQTVVIGSLKIGRYVITEMSEAWERVMDKGEVVKIICDLTLEEYL